jgi:hypothetical protein
MQDLSLSRNAALAGLPPRSGAPRLASLRSRKGLLLAAAVGAIGLFTAWRWFGTAAVLPLLYVVPCLVMMLVCMRGHGGSGNTPANPNDGTASAPDISHELPE